MSLLSLKNIGKIYVSEGTVSVGIRGVNLSFERGEFVAVTGKSGSGKSTLLNIISGMDSYEEGELYIEDEPTSHYMQPDWEEYREKYISFIFQDYNIIESFTVLENVELALMHIENKHERRARAMELIRRVGLTSHAKQKGSRLSGGQKQRTVIARALAKDSPILLADEPTGNLDSETSREIVKLLHEVAKDKLLIVVTHNFDEVAEYATRQIRIFDSAVEFDHTIRPSAIKEETPAPVLPSTSSKRSDRVRRDLGNGMTLGVSIFRAKPRLSVFLCLLLLVSTLGVFFITAFCADSATILRHPYMFRHIDGRLVLASCEGQTLTEEEIGKLASSLGAKKYLRYDLLLDADGYAELFSEGEWAEAVSFHYAYGENYGAPDMGRYPTAVNEVLLYLPISYRPDVGLTRILTDQVKIGGAAFHVTGVKYYYDNNQNPKLLFSEEGFRTMTALHYARHYVHPQISVEVTAQNGEHLKTFSYSELVPSFAIAEDRIYIPAEEYRYFISKSDIPLSTTVTVELYGSYDTEAGGDVNKIFTDAQRLTSQPEPGMDLEELRWAVVVGDETVRDMAETLLERSYTQASLFFNSDKEAHRAAEKLRDMGYVAVPSDTTYEPNVWENFFDVFAAGLVLTVWSITVIFIFVFFKLCSGRAFSAFRSDMAIMRSMGIPVRVIRIGMYVRMLLSLIPAIVGLALTALFVFTVPLLNSLFCFLYAWQYAAILLGVLAASLYVTHKQIRKLFDASVKKALKGGRAA